MSPGGGRLRAPAASHAPWPPTRRAASDRGDEVTRAGAADEGLRPGRRSAPPARAPRESMSAAAIPAASRPLCLRRPHGDLRRGDVLGHARQLDSRGVVGHLADHPRACCKQSATWWASASEREAHARPAPASSHLERVRGPAGPPRRCRTSRRRPRRPGEDAGPGSGCGEASGWADRRTRAPRRPNRRPRIRFAAPGGFGKPLAGGANGLQGVQAVCTPARRGCRIPRVARAPRVTWLARSAKAVR